MCLIIKKPAGRRICPEFIENAWERNRDGWGSFHLEQGRLVCAKGMDLGSLLAYSGGLPQEQEVFVHLRKATYGAVNHDMAHPYPVRDGLMLMHNGSIEHLAPTDPQRSDTAELARLLCDMLEGLSSEQAALLVRSEGFARLMAPLVKGSMVVLLDTQGPVRLGRDWHAVQAHEWNSVMQGMEVSNRHAWQPRDMARPRTDRSRWQRLAGWTVDRLPKGHVLRLWPLS